MSCKRVSVFPPLLCTIHSEIAKSRLELSLLDKHEWNVIQTHQRYAASFIL